MGRAWIWGVAGGLGAVVTFMAQVSFETARSNIASYVEAVGPDRIAVRVPENADTLATIAGVSVMVIASVAWSIAVARKGGLFAKLFGQRMSPYRELLVGEEWVFEFNPKLGMSKALTFNEDGTIGDGRNQNEDMWRMIGNDLEIVRKNGTLQNRYRYDEMACRWLSTNDHRSEGLTGQTITRKT